MKRLFFIATVLLSALLFGSATEAFAQTSQTPQISMSFNDVDEKPQFLGTDGTPKDFSRWVNDNIQYPEVYKDASIQGRVTVRFTIDKDGSVKNVKVLRGLDSAADKEAIRVISSSPKWKPGRHNGEPVAVTYVFPVVFILQ